MTGNLSICPNGCGVRHENGIPTKTNCARHANANATHVSSSQSAAAIPSRKNTKNCPRHGGQWGDDETCEHCTDDDGNVRPADNPGPMTTAANQSRSPVDRHWEDPISELCDYGQLSASDIGEDDYGPYIETDDGRGYHEVGYTEYLDFHNDNESIDAEFLLSSDDPDAEGWLNDRGEAAVKDRIARLLAEGGMDKDIADSLEISSSIGGDEPNFTMSLAVPSDADMTVKQMFDNISDPFFGSMKNSTDPGTFGHSYLFSDLKTPDSYFLSLPDGSPQLDAIKEQRYADYENGHALRGEYNTVPELIALKRSGRLIGGEAENTAADWTEDESAAIKQAWKRDEHRDLIEEHFSGEADEARRETQ